MEVDRRTFLTSVRNKVVCVESRSCRHQLPRHGAASGDGWGETSRKVQGAEKDGLLVEVDNSGALAHAFSVPSSSREHEATSRSRFLVMEGNL